MCNYIPLGQARVRGEVPIYQDWTRLVHSFGRHGSDAVTILGISTHDYRVPESFYLQTDPLMMTL